MGIVLAGSGAGGLVLSPIFNIILTRLGVRWALRILGIWNFLLGVPVAMIVTRKHAAAAAATGQSRISMAVAKRGAFVLQVRCRGSSLLEHCGGRLTSAPASVHRCILTSRGVYDPRILSHDVLGFDTLVWHRDEQCLTRHVQWGEQPLESRYGDLCGPRRTPKYNGLERE